MYRRHGVGEEQEQKEEEEAASVGEDATGIGACAVVQRAQQ